MRKKLLSLALFSSFVMLFSGCSSKLPPETMNTNKELVVEAKYKFSENFNVTKDMVSKKIVDTMIENRKYVVKQKRGIYLKGMEVSELKDNIIKVSYFDGFGNHDGSIEATEVRFKLPYNITETSKNNYNVKLTYPKNFEYIGHTDILGSPMKPLDTFANLEADVVKMMNSIKTTPFIFTRTISETIKNEVNSKYPDKAIYANFDRIMGKYSWKTGEKVSETKKMSTFRLNYKNKTYPVYVEVFPYQNGSKAKYEISYSYEYDSNGKTTKLSQNDIAEIHKIISKVVND